VTKETMSPATHAPYSGPDWAGGASPKTMSRATRLAMMEIALRFGSLAEPIKEALCEEVVRKVSWELFQRYQLKAEERVIVAKRLLEEAEESARLVKTKWLLFVHDVDAAIELAGATGKKDTILESAFDLLRKRHPELRECSNELLKRTYYREKKKHFNFK
jgi:hypothetical protein